MQNYNFLILMIYLFSNCPTQSIHYKLEEQIAGPQKGIFVIWSGVLIYINNLLHFTDYFGLWAL